MDEIALAIMARMDGIRDNVTEIRLDVAQISESTERHEQRLESLEDISDDMKTILKTVSSDLVIIKNGPVYSIDRFITKRVAQVTGGIGMLAFIGWTALSILI